MRLRSLFRFMPVLLVAVALSLCLGGCKKDRKAAAVENTQMGYGFTPEKFAEVNVGDSLQDVRVKLGQPYQALASNDNRRKHLIYSWPRDKKKEYVGYDLWFDDKDKVVEKYGIIIYETVDDAMGR